MKHLPPVLSVLVLAALVAWGVALRRGPGAIELFRPDPWPKDLPRPVAPDPGATLTGSVRTADDQPASEALVQTRVTRAGETHPRVRWAWTDAAGRFELTGLGEPGPRTLVVLAADHMPARFEAEVPGEAPPFVLTEALGPLELLPELDLGDLDGRLRLPTDGPELGPLEVLLVPVLDADERAGTADTPGDVGALLAGRVPRRAPVAPDGSWTLAELAAGFYEVQVLPAWASGGTWPVLGRGVLEHDPGGGRPTFPVPVEPAGLDGALTGADGAPLVGALVEVRQDARAWPATTSDTEGRYAVGHLEPGTYAVRALAGDVEATAEVTVAAGEVLPLDLVLR